MPACTIRDDLVEPLREGAYADLYRAVAEALALVEVGDRHTIRERLDKFEARINGDRALLDALGWATPDAPYAIELDVRQHRPALERAAEHVHARLDLPAIGAMSRAQRR